MMKKILGSIVVASALLLTACGYSPEEQKFYDACVAKANESAEKLALVKKLGSADGDSAKKVCENFISVVKKNFPSVATADEIKKAWEGLTVTVKKL